MIISGLLAWHYPDERVEAAVLEIWANLGKSGRANLANLGQIWGHNI